jgi:hypothetical protein
MHKILASVFMGLLCCVGAQNANAKKVQMNSTIASGIYSNVFESPESGDRGGIEFRLYSEASPAYVEAVVCESECNGEGRYYLRPTINGFVFTWSSSRHPNDAPIEFRVSKEKNGIWIEGANGQWERNKLKLRKKPFGLLGAYEWARP